MQTTNLPTEYYGDGADNDRDERLAHEALGDRETQRQADARRSEPIPRCTRCDGRREVLIDPNNLSHLIFGPCPRCRGNIE